ncbi:hypothetical protein H5410_051845, partial [Solanum commersonii]
MATETTVSTTAIRTSKSTSTTNQHRYYHKLLSAVRHMLIWWQHVVETKENLYRRLVKITEILFSLAFSPDGQLPSPESIDGHMRVGHNFSTSFLNISICNLWAVLLPIRCIISDYAR